MDIQTVDNKYGKYQQIYFRNFLFNAILFSFLANLCGICGNSHKIYNCSIIPMKIHVYNSRNKINTARIDTYILG